MIGQMKGECVCTDAEREGGSRGLVEAETIPLVTRTR